MGHDEFCLFCAVAHGHGPNCLRHESYFTDEEFAEEMLGENPDLKLEAEEIVEIIKDLFDRLSESENASQWLPEGVIKPNGFRRSVAIGHWDDEGNGISREVDGKHVFPTGKGVAVYVVDDIFSGMFNQVITTETKGEVVEDKTLHCEASEENPSFFIHGCCYHYLRAWLDTSNLPKPIRAVEPPLSFPEELYEIVNSRQELRELYKGPLPCLNYGGAEGYLDQYQEFFAPMRREGTKTLAKAINEGLRGDDLIPSIQFDFRVWMFMSPDIWPIPSDPPSTPVDLSKYPASGRSKTPFDNLPEEVFQLISCQLPVDDFLNLSSTCRQLRCRLLGHAFRIYVLSGPLRWILPVASFRGELERANEAAMRWLGPSIAKASPASPFTEPSFPYFDFVRACYASFSMMNRRRLWGMAQQFNGLWKDYRTIGWEVDRFYTS